jgi:putative peptidoglycan lipid II flippase
LGVLLMGPLGYSGLALANSLAVSAEVMVLLFILRRRLGGVEGRETLQALARIALASLMMGGAVVGVLALQSPAGVGAFGRVAVGGVAGVLAYIVAGLLLGVQPLYRLPAVLLARR